MNDPASAHPSWQSHLATIQEATTIRYDVELTTLGQKYTK